jgi:hypothetical protein
VHPAFKQAAIEDVGLQHARSIEELGHFEKGALLKYLDAYASRPVLIYAKQILYGADFSEEKLISWQKSAKQLVQKEREEIAKQPAAIFGSSYPMEITAVLDTPVCTWRDTAVGARASSESNQGSGSST